MGKTISDKQVLAIAGVKNYRCFGKKEAIKVAEYYDQMETASKIRILELFSGIQELTASVCTAYCSYINDLSAKNHESQLIALNAYQKELDRLIELSKDESLTFEQTMEIMDRIADVTRRISEKDTENKKHHQYLVKGFLFLVAALGIYVGSQGIENYLSNNGNSENEDETTSC